MRTQKQREASRRNGSKSKGPVTPEGKARASRNATTHGLHSPAVLLASENPQDYLRWLEDYTAVWRPQTRLERDLVIDMVNARWRLERLLAMEAASLDYEIDAARRAAAPDPIASTDAATRAALAFNRLASAGPALALAGRHESRLRRAIDRAAAHLRLLRQRKSDESNPAPDPACEPPTNV